MILINFLITTTLLMLFSSTTVAVDVMGNQADYPTVDTDGISFFIRTSSGLFVFDLSFSIF